MLGTPEAGVLAKFRAHGAAHVNFDFPYQKGIGIAQLIPHASPDCIDLMMKVRTHTQHKNTGGGEGQIYESSRPGWWSVAG